MQLNIKMSKLQYFIEEFVKILEIYQFFHEAVLAMLVLITTTVFEHLIILDK